MNFFLKNFGKIFIILQIIFFVGALLHPGHIDSENPFLILMGLSWMGLAALYWYGQR